MDIIGIVIGVLVACVLGYLIYTRITKSKNKKTDRKAIGSGPSGSIKPNLKKK